MFLEQNVLFGKSLKISHVLIGLEDGGLLYTTVTITKQFFFSNKPKIAKNTL